MQKLIFALFVLAFSGCASAPQAPAPVPPPVIAPKPPTEPFGALLELKKNPSSIDVHGSDRVTRQQFKDHLLHGYSAADRLDGAMDGSAPIPESCKELLELCKSADATGEGKLSLKEFLDKLDEIFAGADRNRDRVLRRQELQELASRY